MRTMGIAPAAGFTCTAGGLGRFPPAQTRRYEPFIAESQIVGWITPDRVQRLARWPNVFQRSGRAIELAPGLVTPEVRTTALAEVARTLSAEGALTAWRDERYAVSTNPCGA